MPDEFWPDFIKNYWEQEPTSFKLPADKTFLSLDELFALVTSKKPNGRLWVGTNLPPKTVNDFNIVPAKLFGLQKADINFDGFFKRMSKKVVGVNYSNLHELEPEIWQRVQSLTTNLNRVDNRPPVSYWTPDTFFGTYNVTPFGVHKDPYSGFAFMLKGERTYCNWEPDYFTKDSNFDAIRTPDIDKIRPHLGKGKCFTIKPGEVVYWPSKCWHVVLSNGKPTVCITIGAGFKPEDMWHWDDFSTKSPRLMPSDSI